MASADQLKALLRSHIAGDDEHFFAVAMQLAAHEARLGHGKLAEELRALIDNAKSQRGAASHRGATPISKPRGDLANLLSVSYAKARLGDLVLTSGTGERLQRIIKEQRNVSRIREHGLSPRRKLLLLGPPGTGKTLTATVLAGELGLPLFTVRLDALLTKFMGETAAKLRQVFDAIADVRGVYFFDEFDAIGSHRGMMNDIGEIRRVLNSFLQMIEQDQSNSVIIAATNHAEILDSALFRRFDDVIEYELPGMAEIALFLSNRLQQSGLPEAGIVSLARLSEGLSYAEIARATDEALKDSIIHEREVPSVEVLSTMIKERQTIRNRR